MNGNLLKQYENIITSLSTVALSRVEGVVPVSPAKRAGKNRGIQVFIEDDNLVTVNVSVNMYHDSNVSDLAYAIQEGIKNDVENATIFKVKAVNVNVVGVIISR